MLSNIENADNLNMIRRQFYQTSELHFYAYLMSTFGNHERDVIGSGDKAEDIYTSLFNNINECNIIHDLSTSFQRYYHFALQDNYCVNQYNILTAVI